MRKYDATWPRYVVETAGRNAPVILDRARPALEGPMAHCRDLDAAELLCRVLNWYQDALQQAEEIKSVAHVAVANMTGGTASARDQ